MAKDAVATMGAVLPDDAGGRDAVHVAVFSAVCLVDVSPGAPVIVASHGETDTVVRGVGMKKDSIGIVDPFISGRVRAGERFWVYLMPRTITALSHKWSHPAFEQVDSSYVPPSQKLISEKWLRDYCIRNDVPSYEELMGAISSQWDNGSEYIHFGNDAHGNITPELWNHVEHVLGRKMTGKRPTYFSCSC